MPKEKVIISLFGTFSTADIIQNKYIYNKNADDVTWTRTQGIFQVIVTSLDNIILTIGQYPSF